MKPVFFFLILLLTLPSTLYAGFFSLTDYHSSGPIPHRIQNPLYLPILGPRLESTRTTPKGKWYSGYEIAFSNIFEFNASSSTTLDVDMELIRQAIIQKRGLTKNLEIGIEIPVISTTGGFLDSFVQGWHDVFGLPNGGRDTVDNGRYNFSVVHNGTTLYNANSTPLSLSDIVLFSKLKLFEETKGFPGLALKTELKLPTGRLNSGTSNLRPDIGLSFYAQKSYKRFHTYSLLGLVVSGGHSRLGPIFKKASVTFGQAFEFNFNDHLSMVAQLLGQTAHYKNTDIHELDHVPLDLTVGFTGKFNSPSKKKQWFYQLGFSEDVLSKGASVDFGVHGRLGVEY